MPLTELKDLDLHVWFSEGQLHVTLKVNEVREVRIHDLRADREEVDERLYALSQIMRAAKPSLDSAFQRLCGETPKPVICGHRTEDAKW